MEAIVAKTASFFLLPIFGGFTYFDDEKPCFDNDGVIKMDCIKVMLGAYIIGGQLRVLFLVESCSKVIYLPKIRSIFFN